MSDREVSQGEFPADIITEYKDMGDGTHAPVIATRSIGPDGELAGDDNPSPVYIGTKDSVIIDAFGRWKVSNPTGLFDSTHLYDDNPLLWYEKLTASGTATYDADKNEIALAVAGNGDAAIRQSKTYLRYQPGKSHLVILTGVVGAAVAGVTKRLGYYDANNGAFLQQTSAGIAAVLRSSASGSATDNAVLQSAWNIDTMDGDGASGITLDFTKSQILIIDLQWLGVGRVRVGFEIDGKAYWAHQFLNTNNLSQVYMQSASLPVRYEIIGGAGATAATLTQICSAVVSEGGAEEERGFPFGYHTVVAQAVTTIQPIVSIRPKATFNSKANRGQILVEFLELFTVTKPIQWSIVYGGTLTGAAWTDVDATYSHTQRDIAASAVSGGIEILCGYGGSGGNVNQRGGAAGKPILSRLALALDIDGTHPTTPLTDTITLVATSLDTVTNVYGGFNWRELR